MSFSSCKVKHIYWLAVLVANSGRRPRRTENRAFDHYFGTMAGVRGFNDANIQTNNGVPVWKQLTTAVLTNETAYVTPWYLNYLGGNWSEATQCMIAGSNGWHQNHAAWNHGTNDHWAMNNTPWSIGFYKRNDLPTQWALVDNWIVADMYQVPRSNPLLCILRSS